MFIKTEDEAVY